MIYNVRAIFPMSTAPHPAKSITKEKLCKQISGIVIIDDED